MLKQIGFVASNEKMARIAKKMFAKYEDEVAVETGSMDLGVEIAESLIKNGAKVIISRGGIAKTIKNRLEIPVIEVPITVEDIAEAILEASTVGKAIALVGFNNLFRGLKLLNPLLKINFEQVFISDHEEIESEIIKLKNKGIDVIIGGEFQCKIAGEQQLKSVLLKSGSKAISHAYQEAKIILDTLMYERRKMEEIRAILDYTRAGYVAINQKGEITLINPAALQLIPHYNNEPFGKPLQEVYPSLASLIDVLSTGKERFQDIISIGPTNVLCDQIALMPDKEVIGAVAIFQDIDVVQKAEHKIRKNFLSKGWHASYTLNDIKGESTAIIKSIQSAQIFSSTDSAVLITGESGVGKELFAQGIHNMSNRKHGPFVGVNCASLPESILESELFGYQEGAFTGAKKSGKPGLFEIAHCGTIFLDEISEIPLLLQGRLLRVLQEKEVMRLGSDKVIPIDTRIIAASNRNLATLVAEKKFREDLYFRLNVLRLHVPPLRERKEDIYKLAIYFLEKSMRNNKIIFTKPAIETLCNYLWPGNIRELQNLMERISIMSVLDAVVSENYVKNLLIENEPLLASFANETFLSKQKIHISKEEIVESLRISAGNKERSARLLGIHRSTLWRWLKKYQIDLNV